MNETLAAPAADVLLESSTVVGSLDVMVTVVAESGVAPRLTYTGACIKTPVVALFTELLGAVTVAVICVYCCCDGVEKPLGCAPSDSVVVPAPTGWKLVGAEDEPAAKTTGLVVNVPTAVFELVRSMLTGPTLGFSWP